MVGQIYRHHIRPIPCVVFIIKLMGLYVCMIIAPMIMIVYNVLGDGDLCT